MFGRKDDSEDKIAPFRVLNLKGVSQFFYQKSNLVTGVSLTAIFVGYLLFVMMGKGAGFEVAR